MNKPLRDAETKTHGDLEVWKMSIELARNTCEFTKHYPKDEVFGLVSQMRRCAVSIASNIAEGAARNGNKEFLQFLYIALGSVGELDTQIEISRVTGVADQAYMDELQENAIRVKMMLNGLIRSLKQRRS